MTNNYETVAIIISIIVGVLGTLAVVYPRLKKEGISAGTILKEAEEGVEDVGSVIRVVQEFVPSKALNILSIVDNLALKATKAAQQLYISSQLSIDQRKSSAKDSIIAGLKAFNIPITDNLEIVIDAAIEKCVIDTKTENEIKAQENNTVQSTISDLQKQISDLQATNTQLTQSNADLTNKLNAIQSAVAPSVAVNTTPSAFTVPAATQGV